MKGIKILVLIGMFVLTVGCTNKDELHLVKGSSIEFVDSTEDTLNVEFYSLSDDSLNFAKVDYQGQEYTLPQVVSADGARYDDGRDLSIWLKADKLSLEKRDVDGSKAIEYSVK